MLLSWWCCGAVSAGHQGGAFAVVAWLCQWVWPCPRGGGDGGICRGAIRHHRFQGAFRSHPITQDYRQGRGAVLPQGRKIFRRFGETAGRSLCPCSWSRLVV